MRDRTVPFAVAGVLFMLIVVSLLGANSPTSGQEGNGPTGFLPVVANAQRQNTYLPSISIKPTPTPTPLPTPTPTPTPTPGPAGPNPLPNPSFEEGWYHPNGIPELQIPNKWVFEWEEGYNPLAPEPWNEYVRPEVRVLSRNFLPPQEHDLFIWDGDHTLKVFKGYGALSFRLKTSVYLEPGQYQLEIKVFPDLVIGYNDDGSKIWATDPKSGEVRLTADGESTNWIFPTFGQKNTIRHSFTVSQGKMVDITAAFRGRWAILNNGWFMDDWRLVKLPS